MRLLCKDVVVASCFLSSEKMSEIHNGVCVILVLKPFVDVFLNLSSPMQCLQWTLIYFRHSNQIECFVRK